jgi:hypothetical protein
MSKHTTDPIGEPKVIRGLLPSPAELVFRDEEVKLTIAVAGEAAIGDGISDGIAD